MCSRPLSSVPRAPGSASPLATHLKRAGCRRELGHAGAPGVGETAAAQGKATGCRATGCRYCARRHLARAARRRLMATWLARVRHPHLCRLGIRRCLSAGGITEMPSAGTGRTRWTCRRFLISWPYRTPRRQDLRRPGCVPRFLPGNSSWRSANSSLITAPRHCRTRGQAGCGLTLGSSSPIPAARQTSPSLILVLYLCDLGQDE